MATPASSVVGSSHSAQTSFSGLIDYTRGSRQSSFHILKTPTDAGSMDIIDGNQEYIYALDTATTKLKIPLSAVEPTMAFDDDGLVPGLCRLFLEGRCHQMSKCYQVHAQPSVVEKLREQALRTPTCCCLHGADSNFEGFPLGLTVTIEGWEREREIFLKNDGNDCSSQRHNLKMLRSDTNLLTLPDAEGRKYILSTQNLSSTQYLWKHYLNSGSMHLTVPSKKVCREHLKGLCRFGDACRYLHGCRSLLMETPGNTRRINQKMTEGDSFSKERNCSHNCVSSDPEGIEVYHSSSVSNNPGILQYSMNFCASGSNSLDSKKLDSMASSKNLSFSVKHEQLLKPLRGRGTLDQSCNHSTTSFSHNPYAQTCF